MLEPNPRKRFTILQVKLSPWIYSNIINEFHSPDQDWLKLVYFLFHSIIFPIIIYYFIM